MQSSLARNADLWMESMDVWTLSRLVSTASSIRCSPGTCNKSKTSAVVVGFDCPEINLWATQAPKAPTVYWIIEYRLLCCLSINIPVMYHICLVRIRYSRYFSVMGSFCRASHCLARNFGLSVYQSISSTGRPRCWLHLLAKGLAAWLHCFCFIFVCFVPCRRFIVWECCLPFCLEVSLDFRRTGCLCFATCSLHSFHTSQSFFLSMFFVDVCNRISSSLFYGFCSAALKYFHSCSLSNVARTSSIEFCVISPRWPFINRSPRSLVLSFDIRFCLLQQWMHCFSAASPFYRFGFCAAFVEMPTEYGNPRIPPLPLRSFIFSLRNRHSGISLQELFLLHLHFPTRLMSTLRAARAAPKLSGQRP